METLFSLTLLALVGTITPGPNNIIVMTIAAQAGMQRALIAIGAVTAGAMVLILLVWAGVGLFINQQPVIYSVVLFTGLVYLFSLGVSLIRSSIKAKVSSAQMAVDRSPGSGLPHSFVGISLFQLLNPKAWVFMTGMATILSQEFGDLASLGFQVGIFTPISVLSLGIWAVFGRSFTSKLDNRDFRIRFDIVMGLLLALPAAYLAVQALSAPLVTH